MPSSRICDRERCDGAAYESKVEKQCGGKGAKLAAERIEVGVSRIKVVCYGKPSCSPGTFCVAGIQILLRPRLSPFRRAGPCRVYTLLEVETGHYYPKVQDGNRLKGRSRTSFKPIDECRYR